MSLGRIPRSFISYLFAAVLVTSAVMAAVIVRTAPQQAPEIEGAVLATPLALPNFELRDHNGRSVHKVDLKGRWQLISYGYTQCPDICPTMLSSLAGFRQLLDQESKFADLQVLFYSIDPERDSVEKLANYVPWFDRRFLGLRADDAKQAAIFERSLGLQRYTANSDEPADGAALQNVGASGPQIAHGFRLYLLDDQARLRASLAPISARDGSKYYEAETLLHDYLALRTWFAKQG